MRQILTLLMILTSITANAATFTGSQTDCVNSILDHESKRIKDSVLKIESAYEKGEINIKVKKILLKTSEGQKNAAKALAVTACF